MPECWASGTATFMILGNICTRACKFCNVTSGKPMPVDIDEPSRVARSIRLMKLKHAVITSVDRDDLPDFGAGFWAITIKTIKGMNPSTTLEVLIPDFQGNLKFLEKVIEANPEIISHNLETSRRLTPQIRTKAQYNNSLAIIKHISKMGIVSKSGIMLGLGETENEILETMDDLLEVNCKIMTIGQYLQPTKENHPVVEYIHPDKFEEYKFIGLKKGFQMVESAPLVRSSYHAEKHLK
jgi:lipoic acid synthetase